MHGSQMHRLLMHHPQAGSTENPALSRACADSTKRASDGTTGPSDRKAHQHGRVLIRGGKAAVPVGATDGRGDSNALAGAKEEAILSTMRNVNDSDAGLCQQKAVSHSVSDSGSKPLVPGVTRVVE